MKFPIETVSPSGLTIYATIHHPDGRIWNTLSEEFEAYFADHWPLYAIALAEQGITGYYRGAYPEAIEGVLTTETLYMQSGPTPAPNDPTSVGIAQSQGAALAAIRNNFTAVDNLLDNLTVMKRGEAIAGTLTTTQMTTNIDDTEDDVYEGRVLIWTSGALFRRAAYIQTYDGDTHTFTFSPVSQAPAAGDKFIVI
jgi:hypothetical protein